MIDVCGIKECSIYEDDTGECPLLVHAAHEDRGYNMM